MKEITLTVSSKGQITLPKAARTVLGLQTGSKLKIAKLTKDGVLLEPKLPQEAYYGKFAHLFPGDAAAIVREMRDSDRQ